MGNAWVGITWLLILVLRSRETSASSNITTVFVFNQLDFKFPNDSVRQAAIDSGSYIVGNSNPFAIEVWNNKLFITVPRWLNGSGPTLNFVNIDDQSNPPVLIPYPNYDINDISTHDPNEKLVSVFGVRADVHDRLWFVDCGFSEIRDRGVRLASPKLHLYDLKNDNLIKTVELSNYVRDRSMFIDLVVDTDSTDPENTFVYLADTRTFAVIIYNLRTNELHRIENNFFHVDSRYGNFVYKGIKYQWPDGITGLTLTNRYADGYKTMLFHSLASLSEYAVSTETLQDKSQSHNFSKYIHVGDRGKNGQSSAESVDTESGVLFFTLIQNNSIGCWNTLTSDVYAVAAFGTVADGLEYPNHLMIDFNRNIWILENDLPKFIYANNSHIFSYKISRIPVTDAIKGTICSL